MSPSEFYSGSDTSNRVPSIVDGALENMDANAEGPADLEALAEALELEREPNWRGFLIGLRGLINAKLDASEQAVEELQLALATFEHHRKSFCDVTTVYCQVSYELGVIHWEREDWEHSSACFLRCVPHMHEVFADAPVFIGNIMGFLDLCFTSMNRYHESLALSEGRASCHARDCSAIEGLLISYDNLEQWQKSKQMFRTIDRDCRDWEFYPRVLDYAKRHKLLED